MSLRTIPVPFPIDLEKTLFPLCRGAGDPTMRIGLADAYLAIRTPDGPATLHVRSIGYDIAARAWGPGADWALASVPGLVGALDDDSGFQPQHHLIDELWRRRTRACGSRAPAP